MVPTVLQPAERTEGRLRPGDEVEVRNRFDRHWAGGFTVVRVESGEDGPRYRLRRHSDGAVLPLCFDATDVRLPRRPSFGR